MRTALLALLLAAPLPVLAAEPAEKPAAAAADKPDVPPLPADKTVRQSAVIAGKSLNYEVTVGTIPVFDAKNKKIGEVVYTAYTVPGRAAAGRPVTFAFNGGPGASSAFLNFGAIGPKRLQFGAQGDAPSDPAIARDNANSWLDLTDLVFIDPVGTGFSRSLEDEAGTKRDFYTAKTDIEYLSRVVFDWLNKNGRLTSPKYLIGESYGGYRVPRLAYYMQSELGVGLNGIVLVSPYLNPMAVDSDDNALSPLPYMVSLPSMAAAKLERDGKLSEAALGDVESYTRSEFATDLFRGRSDPQAIERLTTRVSGYTGLDPVLVRRLEGRVGVRTYLREVHRDQKAIGSIYDSNVTAFDPFPGSVEQQSNDPLLVSIIAPTTSAAVDLMTNQVGWKVQARYNLLSYAVNQAWDRDNSDKPVGDLRRAISADPKMTVIIAHGMDDLSCPYFASRLVIDQMPSFGQAQRVKLALYPGGHMYYSRPDSAAQFRRDAVAMFQR
ncbi:peptidase S10 [uncultured Sphingomonas sp.]|uniref:S10 family peptidase n=1 Tax=uncultured Sphingomonas sp. TaxID=158754 RepID=UPI0025EB3D26|nr:peptidase S10 [uncultured Sphingomonas sp.]